MRNKQIAILIITLLNLNTLSFAQLTPAEAVPLMQKGINLGNTLEPPLEGGWNNPAAQEYYFDTYKQAGFQTIRIPVRWDMHTQNESPFAVSPEWMQRVEQIVDWALQRDLFVIINAHHDDWIKQNYTNPTYRARFDSIWSQISLRFRNKSDRLVFEILNEPNGLTKAQNDELHARVISIIRKTNPTRLIVIQGHNWGGSDELIAAAIPDDDYVIGSFHSYDPYLFGLEGQGTWGTSSDYTVLRNKFQRVKTWSLANNIPVLLGEFGSLKTCDYNSRMLHYRAYVDLALSFGFIYCAWDDGGDFRIMERSSRKWDEVKDILLHSNNASPVNLNLKLVQDTMISVNWTNSIPDADSLIVEHRTETSGWEKFRSLKGDSTACLHTDPVQGAYHYYRIIACHHDSAASYTQPVRLFMPYYQIKTRVPFLGSPLAIPGIIEAEDYDSGGEGFTYHDFNQANLGGAYRMNEGADIYSRNSDGYQLGSLLNEEWYEYSVNVTDTGKYKVGFYLAALLGGGTLMITIDDVNSSIIKAPNTNSRLITKIVNDTMDLTAGNHILRLKILNADPSYNIDKIEFTRIMNTSINADASTTSFHSYASGHRIFIKSDGTKINKINLINLSGIVVCGYEPDSAYFEFSSDGFPAGVYIIQAISGTTNYFNKLLID